MPNDSAVVKELREKLVGKACWLAHDVVPIKSANAARFAAGDCLRKGQLVLQVEEDLQEFVRMGMQTFRDTYEREEGPDYTCLADQDIGALVLDPHGQRKMLWAHDGLLVPV